MPASPLAIYCADIGSIPNRRFGWACTDAAGNKIERDRGGAEIDDLVETVAADIADGRAVALGFECPLYVPVPQQPLRLGTARSGESNRSWSAGAGAGALASGAVQVAWILHELRQRGLNAQPFLDWAAFTGAGAGLFLWEAFVTDRAKAASHIDDATVAVTAFWDALPDVTAANAVTAERPLSLLGAALLWSGWSNDLALLHAPCLVIKATPPDALEAEAAAGGPAKPTAAPRGHRDRREIERKRALLEEPHVAPLTQFVRRLRQQRGGDSVPWFDPTEAGVNARILLLFENPGRRADAGLGSGFISADNDDRSAQTMWGIFREAGIDRRRDVVNWNIVPWYVGDQHKIGKVRTSDLDEARPALVELVSLLPDLRVVVLCGRKAQEGWDRARLPLDLPLLRVPHPSGRWLNAHPEDRDRIVAALAEARRLAYREG